MPRHNSNDLIPRPCAHFPTLASLPVKRFLVLLVLSAFVVGCGPTTSTTPTTPAKSNDPPSHNHPTTGPHGGPIVEWSAEDELHLEVVIDHKTGAVTVYVLDEQVKDSVAITTKTLTLSIPGTPPITVSLTADPDEGDRVMKGVSSRFTGQDDALKSDQLFSGSVSGEKDGRGYTGKFKEKKPK